jgi:CHAT domain-containing protein
VALSLRKDLIAPLEDAGALRGISQIGLVPFSFLHDVPFSALARVDSAKTRFLIEDYILFQTPSATFLEQNSSTSHVELINGSLLAVGTSESVDMQPLESAVDEVRAIAQTHNASTLLNHDASETQLKRLAPHFSYIHLATHGLFEPDMPLLSSLVVRSSDSDDGYLTAREIFDLGLKAELVTLSACETGRSFPASGNIAMELDRVGLIEAFLHAGSRSVMATLLPVSDRATTEFMKRFYLNLRGASKAEALAQAQRAALQGEVVFLDAASKPHKMTHPRYWAPFIMVGSYR